MEVSETISPSEVSAGLNCYPVSYIRIRTADARACSSFDDSTVHKARNGDQTEQPDTIAILGAGLDLGWLEAPGFDGKQLAPIST